MQGTSFDSTKTPLHELLQNAHIGKLQLPDFQRGWIWDDERIRSLLASVSVSFPIGAVMLLATGGDVQFKPRPLAGTSIDLAEIEPETLILDGQQRLTALYQALQSQTVVDTRDSRNKPIKRWYYIDIDLAIDPEADREDAVISVPDDKLVRAFGRDEPILDLTTPEREYEQALFPVNRIYGSSEWRQAYYRACNYDQVKIERFDAFESDVIKRFEQYQVPVIELKKETPKVAVCLVFERVNTGGVALGIFELLTATFAAENYQLRDDWEAREKRLKEQHPVLRNLDSDSFLQAVSLLVTQQRRRDALATGTPGDRAPGVGCKRKDILRLKAADWLAWADRVEEGLVRAARFLHSQKIFKARDLPYGTQLVPLAAIMVDLGLAAEPAQARQRLARWFWCGVLGELYGGAIETRFVRDLQEVTDMIRGGDTEPATIREANFQAERLLTLRTRNSSAYKGLYALLMRDGCLDFRTGEPIEAQTFFDDKIDIHHIFPEAWCKANGIGPEFYNSVINKTALSARTNRQLGGNAPSRYLPPMERHVGAEDKMDEILRSHCIAPAMLRADDFWGFFSARAEALLHRIEDVTGKTIAREAGLFGATATPEVYDEGPEDWDDDQGFADAAGE